MIVHTNNTYVAVNAFKGTNVNSHNHEDQWRRSSGKIVQSSKFGLGSLLLTRTACNLFVYPR